MRGLGGRSSAAGGALGAKKLLRPGGPESLQAQLEGGVPGLELDLSLSHNRGSVIGLLRWKVLLAQEGRKPAPAPATPRPQAGGGREHQPRDNVQLILTQPVEEPGVW
ncbi:hypothetical protein J1605_008461, partial [Eschrichtius robustus]